MQLKIGSFRLAFAGVGTAITIAAGVPVVGGLAACGGDGPSIWSSGLTTGTTGNSSTYCSALTQCCALLSSDSMNGASCNGGVPAGASQAECAEVLGAFQATGSCVGLGPDAGTPSTGSTLDAGTHSTDAGTLSTDAGSGMSGVDGTFVCNEASNDICQVRTGDTGTSARDCADSLGTEVTACPTTSLLGCCVPNSSSSGLPETCYYPGANGNIETASDVMQNCAALGLFTYSATQ